MRQRPQGSCTVIVGVLLALSIAQGALGDEGDRGRELFPAQAALVNAAYGQQPWRACERQRAGFADCVKRQASPSDNGHYAGYYVGGGRVARGEGRYLDEGTFGWDYTGWFGLKRVALGWSHR